MVPHVQYLVHSNFFMQVNGLMDYQYVNMVIQAGPLKNFII